MSKDSGQQVRVRSWDRGVILDRLANSGGSCWNLVCNKINVIYEELSVLFCSLISWITLSFKPPWCIYMAHRKVNSPEHLKNGDFFRHSLQIAFFSGHPVCKKI